MEVLQMIFPLTCDWLQWRSDEAKCAARDITSGEGNFCTVITEQNISVSALLFQLTVSECARDGHAVLIMQKPMKTLPKPVHGMPHPEARAMTNLKILYMENSVDLVNYLASVHQLPLLPELIIVENLHCYVQEQSVDSQPHALARLCALLCDARDFISSKSKRPCKVAVSTQDRDGRLLDVCHRYSTNVMFLKGGKGTTDYNLEMSRLSSKTVGDVQKKLIVHYTEEDTCVVLKDLMVCER